MTANAISVTQFQTISLQTASTLASGWSEAASRYVQWVAIEEIDRVLSETEKFDRLALELNVGFRSAAAEADEWAQAARVAGHEGAAKVYERYAVQYLQKANNLLDTALDAKSRLNLLAADASASIRVAGGVFGRTLGTALGPAFDAYQMASGLVEWAQTGSSDKFGGACMGVVMSVGLGILGVAIAATVGLPAIGIAVVAGVGAVTYHFNRGDGADTISDGSGGRVETDKLKFGVGITEDQLWFRRNGNHLDVGVIGTSDNTRINNWYASVEYQIEVFELSDGQRLLNSQVNNLVQAMAAFAPPAPGETTLPATYQTALAPVIAANWN